MKTRAVSSRTSGTSWSQLISEHYSVRLDDSLADWWDEELWCGQGSGEFRIPVAPSSLLVPAPEILWPGLMPPDTLPIIGNGHGDWLCLRIGRDNQVTEILQWYHGGGDWLPWGRTLAEAFLFDSLRNLLPGRRREHAISAEPSVQRSVDNPWFRWALGWFPELSSESPENLVSSTLADVFLSNHIAEIAVRCELTIDALDCGLRELLSPEVARRLNVPWEPDVVSWLFDSELMANWTLAEPVRRMRDSLVCEQDWQAAVFHASQVAQLRSDLLWPHDVQGWFAERRGDYQLAADHYGLGRMAFAFTDQSIRFRTHWFPQTMGKFSLWRLQQLRLEGKCPGAFPADVEEYLQVLQSNRAASPRAAVTHYWNRIAATALKSGQFNDAYEAYYRGGWDLGVDRMIGYRGQLSGLIDAAEQDGQIARAKVARAHLQALRVRFGDG